MEPPNLARSGVAAPEAYAEAFRVLYELHVDFVLRTLVYLGVPKSLAEDAAQEVFLTLHRRLRDYDMRRPLRGYLWGICRHVAQSHRRKQARILRRESVAPTPEPAVLPDDALEKKRATIFVRDFIDTLNEDLSTVFVLVALEGRTAPEVAAALGLNVNTVYSRVRLARERLRRASGTRLRKVDPT